MIAPILLFKHWTRLSQSQLPKLVNQLTELPKLVNQLKRQRVSRVRYAAQRSLLLLQFRVALPNLTIFPSTACQSMLWLLEQEPSQLCSKSKYCSCASVAGRAYVEKKPIPVSEDDSRAVFQLVQTVADEVTAEYSVPQTWFFAVFGVGR